MKALEKDRARRYETASGLAADVERYLADEPVEACPPSAAYRLRKFVRRHKGPVAGGVVRLPWHWWAGSSARPREMLRAAKAEAHAVGESNQKQAALTEREAALVAARQSKRSADVRSSSLI